MNNKGKRFRSLATRISAGIILFGTLVFVTVLGANYFLSRNLLEEYIGELARATASSTVREIETVFTTVATNADSLASVVTKADINEPQIHDAIKAFLKTNADIFGMTVALEPHVLHENIGEFSPYYYREQEAYGYANLADNSYRYLEWDWYRQPKSNRKPVWTEPYLDEGGGNVLMTTYATPIWRRDDNRFAGVATADISLGWLQKLVDNIHIGETGFGMIISEADIIVAHPDKQRNMLKLKSTLEAEFIRDYWDVYTSSKSASHATYFHAPCRHKSGDCWVAIEPLLDTGWKIVIVIPESELVSDIMILTLKITALAVIGLIILVMVILSVTHRLTSPLARLASVTKDIGEGRLNIKLPRPQRNDEIGELTNDFRLMRDSLEEHIDRLQETTAKKQKLESEIEIAKDIQMSMVPGGGTVSITEATYQLYALLRPARSVGGDLYYFQQDDNKLHFIIGDVSDKGVPAALFMAKAVTLYAGALNDGLTPGNTFTHMNQALAQNNDACMFVTALCGTLDLDSGELTIANAGHMNPLYKTSDTSGELPVEGSLALGLMDDVEYPNITHQLAPGSHLLMYTDGISEAFNPAREQYEEERLLAFVSNCPETKAESLGTATMQDVEAFVNGADQSDDITLMVIQYDNA